MLTRNEYVQICSSCINRKFDPQQGVVCGLTSNKADFDDECPSYELDPKTQNTPTPIMQETGLKIEEEEKKKAEKDILYGILWLAVGTILTFFNIDFLLYPTIIIGGIQLVQGLIGIAKND